MLSVQLADVNLRHDRCAWVCYVQSPSLSPSELHSWPTCCRPPAHLQPNQPPRLTFHDWKRLQLSVVCGCCDQKHLQFFERAFFLVAYASFEDWLPQTNRLQMKSSLWDAHSPAVDANFVMQSALRYIIPAYPVMPSRTGTFAWRHRG